MKIMLSLLVMLAGTAAAFAQDPAANPELEQDYGPGFWDTDIDTTFEDGLGGENHVELPAPDEVETFERRNEIEALIAFPQTKWNECRDKVTGNYVEYACTAKRNISVILNTYLQQKLISCVDAGLAAQGGGRANAIHVNHAGITGDSEHSPRSLHAVNRAVDVKMIKVDLTNGTKKDFTYSKTGNRPFYTALRNCWGNVVKQSNGCPLYNGNPFLTGSIGWENSDHGRHMHLSVPYCVNGAYGSYYWVR